MTLPVADLILVPFDGTAYRALATEAHGGKNLADVARMVAYTELVANHLGDTWQCPDLGWHARGHGTGLKDRCKLFGLLGAQSTLPTDRPLAFEGLVSACHPFLTPTRGGLTVHSQTTGDFRRRDALLKQANGLEPSLLKGGLINGSLQSHAETIHAERILSLYFASLNNAAQKKTVIRGLILCTILTVFHNPLSGYEVRLDRQNEPARTRCPVGMTSGNPTGHLSLGLVSVYQSALIGTIFMTVLCALAGHERKE